jgi:gliding motility-associated-like protein
MGYQRVLFILTTFFFGNTLCFAGKDKHLPRIFDCPTINSSNIFIQPASSCRSKDGGIFRISGNGTGIHSYTWYDAQKNIVGTDSVLLNVPAGTYTLKMQDESKCAPATAGPFIIPSQISIYMDEKALVITQVTCNNDGAITGINPIGASTYKWVSNTDTSKVLSTTTDLRNIGPGFYTLRAFSSEGCETDSRSYLVDSKMVIPTMLSDTATNPTCHSVSPNGTIVINLQVPRNILNEGFYLIDSQGNYKVYGNLVFTGTNKRILATGLGDGSYKLVIGDPLTCSVTLKTYTLKTSVFTLDTANLVVYNDHCGQRTGVIGPAGTFGGTPGPRTKSFKWTDEKGRVVSNQPYAISLAAGRYKVHVDDVAGCSVDSRFYTVLDITTGVKAPIASAGQLCLPGYAVITIKNLLSNGTYRLYGVSSTGDTVQLQKNTEGKFVALVNKTTTFYVSNSDGTCESPRTPITVVVEEPGVNIPNLFSPNHDGINDFWNITGLTNYPGTIINVYDRAGQIIYSSIGYTKPFDGTRGGLELPQGTYYYTIDLKKKACGAISGSVTIIR